MQNLNLENEQNEEMVMDNTLDFMNKSQKTKYASYYFGKVRTKKEIVPFFDLSKEINGIIKPVTYNPPLQRISGKLTNIEFSEGVYQNQVIKSVIFKFETLSESNNLIGIRINCSRNNALQNWMNCLIGYDKEIKAFEISMWKDKNSGYNKSTCRINGEKPKWAFNLEQLEDKKEKIKDKKGVLLMTKSDDLYDFMDEELKKKLDILLPNRYKEIEKENLNTIIGDNLDHNHVDMDEYTPDFEKEDEVDGK